MPHAAQEAGSAVMSVAASLGAAAAATESESSSVPCPVVHAVPAGVYTTTMQAAAFKEQWTSSRC